MLSLKIFKWEQNLQPSQELQKQSQAQNKVLYFNLAMVFANLLQFYTCREGALSYHSIPIVYKDAGIE